MKEIFFLTSKYKKPNGTPYSTIVDNNVYEFILKNNYNVTLCKNNNKFYSKIEYKEKMTRLHLFIFGKNNFYYKSPKGYVIDHINRNGLDNRLENLREITQRQNCQNRESKNAYNGARWIKKDKKWLSRFSKTHLGYFDTEEEAAKKYDEYLICNPECGDKYNFKYTEDEIETIRTNYIQKEERQLPKHISKRKNDTYEVRIINKELDIKHDKTFKSLEEAIENRDKKLKEIEQLKKEKIYNLPISYIDEGIAYIEVKHKKITEKCIVDADKWHELMLISSWSLKSDNSIVGFINGELIQLHRYLYQKYKNNNKPIPYEMIVDHHKGSCEKTKKLDNRLSNLRMINREQNAFNITNKNPTGYRGVSKNRKKWVAQLRFEKKQIFSKVFDTVEEAALEWNRMVIRTYGKKYGQDFIEHNLNNIKEPNLKLFLEPELIFID